MKPIDIPPILPEEITMKILTHLPAKSVHRFKCVSKNWHSLITSPHFLKAYLTLSPPHPPSWIFIRRFGRLLAPVQIGPLQSLEMSFSLYKPPTVSSLTLSPHRPPHGPPPMVFASSTGLVLFTTSDTLFIANPVTNFFCPLPKPKPKHIFIEHFSRVAFAAKYSPSFNDVSLVVIELRAPTNPSKEAATMLIYSSDKGEWETRPVRYKAARSRRKKGWVSRLLEEEVYRNFEVGGRVFWATPSVGLAVLDDPFGERMELRFIPLPEEHSSEGLMQECALYPVGEFMMCCNMVEEGRSSIWRLSDVEKGEWSCLFTAAWKNPSGLPEELGGLVLEAFHPLEDEMAVFTTKEGEKSVLLNWKENKVLAIRSCPGHNDDVMYSALALPSWPTPIPKRLVATALDGKGCIDFGLKNFKDAIVYHSRSISCLPTAAAYANRAAAKLILGEYLEAEMDSSEALKIDQHLVIAYLYRALARKELGKLLEAKEDVELVLKLDGVRQELVKLYAEIICALEKENVNGEEGGGL